MPSQARTVDPVAGFSDSAKIYVDPEGIIWHVMLNYTDISYGVKGNNKYYMLQVIQEDKLYHFFRKWGRVGAKNPNRALDTGSLKKMQALFKKKFVDKTQNEWPLEDGNFEQMPKKYRLIELDDVEPQEEPEDLIKEESADSKEPPPSSPSPPSKLPEQVQTFLKLICDADLLAKEVAAHHLDIKRMPLGKLSKAQLSQGYRLLDQLSITLKEMDELKQKTETKPQVKVEKSSTIKQATSLSQRRRSSRRLLQVEKEDHEYSTSKTSTSSTNVTVRCSTRTSRLKRCQKVLYKGKTCTLSNALASLKKQLHTLSSEFYTQIPHDFGMDLPPIIDDMAHIRMKMDLLEILQDLELSQKVRRLQEPKRHKNDINPLDQQYEALQVELVPLDPQKDEIYRIIEQYVETTHAPTHIQYKLHVNGILQISRPEEEQFTQVFESINNHKLLWHGSRLCNLIGILSKGLRIAPSEAPTNGYMFGKGIYFADSVSKSANYCWSSPDQPHGVLVLAEVALGKCYEALEAEDLNYTSLKSEKKCESTHGLGRMASPLESHHILKDGVIVPLGEFEPTGVLNGELLYHEYVVYQREQVKLRYVVCVDFCYDE